MEEFALVLDLSVHLILKRLPVNTLLLLLQLLEKLIVVPVDQVVDENRQEKANAQGKQQDPQPRICIYLCHSLFHKIPHNMKPPSIIRYPKALPARLGAQVLNEKMS